MDSNNFSIVNSYEYENKSKVFSALDWLSAPCRRVLGGGNVCLLTHIKEKEMSTLSKVATVFYLIIVFPVGLVSAASLLIKLALASDSKEMKDVKEHANRIWKFVEDEDTIPKSLNPIADGDADDILDIETLDQMLARPVLLPAATNEIEKMAEDKSAAVIPDPVRETYVFKPLKQLITPSSRLLFHIHADEFGASSEYEGGFAKDAMDYLKAHLELAKYENKQTISMDLIEEVNNSAMINSDPLLHNAANLPIETLKKKIVASFESNKPMLIEGGWTGTPSGHTIYYEILPTSNNTANFRLYNSGAGINYHAHAEEALKTKYQPYEEWKEIDRERLESDLFLKALHELKSYDIHPATENKTGYTDEDIYEALKEILKPSKKNVERLNKIVKRSPQRSGVCSWKSLMAFVHAKMNINDYKRFKCDIKLQSLHDYVNSVKTPVGVKEWRLVKKSYQNLCAAIISLYRKRLIGDAYLQSAREILDPISDWIHINARCRFQRNIGDPLFEYKPFVLNKSLENKNSISAKLVDNRNSTSADNILSQPWMKTYDKFKVFDLTDPLSIQQTLGRAVELGKKSWLDKEDFPLYKGLLLTIKRLEYKEEFWKKVVFDNPEKAEALIVQLGELSNLFLKSCFTCPKPAIIFAEKVYALDKIVKLQQTLCRWGLPRNDWQNLSMGASFVHTTKLSSYLNFVEGKMHREILGWQDNVNTGNTRVLITKYNVDYNGLKVSPYSNDSLELSFSNFPSRSGDIIAFQDIIREKYPDVIRLIANKNPKFHELSKFAQDAYIFASEYLPEWIKAIRDADCAIYQLNCGYIGPLTSLDRDSDIQPIFNINDEKQCTEVKISYSGVKEKKTKLPKKAQKGYLGQYRKFIDPSFSIFFNLRYLNEKALLSTTAKKAGKDMPDEDFKELGYILIDTPLQLLETIAYFTKHLEKLNNTDYQTLFHVILFQNGKLLKSLRVPGFKTHLVRFIQNSYQQFLQKNEIQAAVNLLKIAHQLCSFCPNEPFFKYTVIQLKTLITKDHLESSEKCYIYAELIAQLGHQKDISEEEVALIVTGSIYIAENEKRGNYLEDPYTAKEVRDALVRHANKIQTSLVKELPNISLLNSILKRIRPEIAQDYEWTMKVSRNEFPTFITKNGEYLLYPMLSQLISPNVQALLPQKVREDAVFQKLFHGIEKGYYLPGNVFSFKDKQGRETLLHDTGDCLVVDQKLDSTKDEWYRYVPELSFIQFERENSNKITLYSSCGSRFILNHYSHWQSLDVDKNNEVKVYAIDLKSGKPQYVFEAKVPDLESHEIIKILNVNRLSDGFRLGQPSRIFSSFEDPAYIHEWYDQSEALKNIELPRFNLSFTPDSKQSNRMRCDQMPKFFLDIQEPCKELGIHHHYICLKNEKGQCKILLPKQPIKALQKMEVIQPSYEMNRSLEFHELEAQKYLMFDLQKEGRLVNPSREANLYLAQVLLAAQEYKKAAYYLKKMGNKLSPYTKEEANTLRDISSIDKKTGDKSGNGNILRLYANYLLISNSTFNHLEVSLEDMGTLKSNYDLYLDHYSHATLLKLKLNEEIFLLSVLLQNEFKASHYLRLKELDPVAAQKLDLPSIKEKVVEEVAEVLSGFNFNGVNLSSRNVFGETHKDIKLLTRNSHELANNFKRYYDIARRKTSKEREWLQHSLPFIRTAEKGVYRKLANFFEAVLENPKAFSDIPQTYSDRSEWEKKVIEEAKKQLSKVERHRETKKASQVLDLANAHIELDSKSNPVRPIKALYSFIPIESLSKSCKDKGCFIPDDHDKKNDCDSLSHLLQSMETSDPVQNAEISRLTVDLEEYKKKAPSSKYKLNSPDLSIIKEVLSKDNNRDKEQIEILEKEILDLANKSPATVELSNQYRLEKGSGQRKVMTLGELLVCFARQDFTQLVQRNPSLNETDLNNLVKKIGSYLLYTTRKQQRDRSEMSLKKLDKYIQSGKGKETDEYKDLINQLAQDMLTERSFDPAQRPAFLVFEYFAAICMRPAQVKKMEAFLKDGNQNLVMEMIMGSGKSKVLLPLLGFMRADGKILSTIIVPQPLFESVSQDTQNILYDAFSQSLHAIHFDRNTPFTKQKLKYILDKLNAICKNKECLIMTSKSVQCLLLKFIEKCDRHFKQKDVNGTLSEELKMAQKILCVLTQNGYPIIDEADTILNVMHEVSFGGGKRLSPYIHETELISEIYSLVYEDPAIKALARVESDSNPNPNAPVLTESLYNDKVKLPLAKALIQRLGAMHFESQQLAVKVHEYINALDRKEQEHLLHYLCRDSEFIDSAQAYYEGLDSEIQDILALAGEQISHLLPYALTRVCDVKYGLDTLKGTVFAIPFSAANTPSSGSQFSSPHITMNYTFQSYMKKGVTFEMVEQLIKLLQEKAMREIANQGGKFLLKDTLAGKMFDRLKDSLDIPMFNYRPAHIEALVNRINNKPKVKRDFVTYQVIPQMELFEKKMSCNPHHLVALFNVILGFTGTLWNGLSMHHKIKPEPELGTDAHTLYLLWENSRSNAITIKEGSLKGMLQQLKDKSIEFDMISDAGGYFKQGSNSTVAHAIASDSKETVFYNDKGEQTITASSNEVPLTRPRKSPENRKTFLDQSHTVGADVPQKRDAISLVTIGQNMLLRDLLQAVWRLRGLDNSQRVRFLMSEEVAAIIRQKLQLPVNQSIQLDSILKFVIANQAFQQGVDNYKALREELYNIPQQIMLKAMLRENLHPSARLQIYKHLISTWIKPALYSSRGLYGNLATDKPRDFVLELEKKRSVMSIRNLFSAMPWLNQLGLSQHDCIEEADGIIKRLVQGIPAKLKTPAKMIENDQTVEMEKETNTRTQMQLEVQEIIESKEGNLAFAHGNKIKVYDSFDEAAKAIEAANVFRWDGPSLEFTPVFPLDSYLQKDKKLKDFAAAFKGIYVSINILEWENNHDNNKLEELTFLSSRRSNFQHLVVKDSQVILLGLETAAEIEKESADYYHLYLGFNDPDKKPTQDQLFKIIQLKFLNGESQFSEEELKLLKSWLMEHGVTKMHDFYKEHILKGYPKKTARYLNSPLQKLFAEFG